MTFDSKKKNFIYLLCVCPKSKKKKTIYFTFAIKLIDPNTIYILYEIQTQYNQDSIKIDH